MNARLRAVVPAALVLLVATTGCAPTAPHQEKAPQPTASGVVASPEPIASTPAAGTRENPIAVDTLTEYHPESQWRFSVGVTDADATPEITSDNPYLEVPEAKVLVAAPFYVQVKDSGDPAGSSPSMSLVVQYVSAKGNSFQADGAECYGEGHFYGVGDMFPGAEARATICAAVDKDAVVGGTWRVTSAAQPDKFIFLDGAN